MSDAPGGDTGSKPAQAPATRHAGRDRWGRALAREWAWYAITLLATAVFATLALRLWRADLHVPFVFGGDSVYSFMLGREMLDHGWYLTNSRLGAPVGQQLYNWPIGSDTLNLLTLDALVQVSRDAVLGVNLFYLFSFLTSSASAFWALRRLQISRPAAAMAAVLFAIAPFHFLRSEVHIFLAAYWAVPFGVVLATEAMQGRAGIAAPGRRPRFGWALVCAIVATAGLYYAVFTLVLLGAASLVALARSERRAASGAVLAGALIVCLLVVSNAPTFVYEHRHGKAHGVAVRQASESETYGQKLASMVLPMQNHRITALGDVRARYDATVPIGTGMPLGSLPAAGVLTLFFVTLLTAAGGLVRLRGRHPLRDLGALQLALFLVTTIGGFSSLIAYLVSPQIRVWERSTIVFGFLGLATVALLLDAGLDRWRSAARGFVPASAHARSW